MKLTIEAWRQADADDDGRFETYVIDDATAEMSLLDVLDRLNDHLVDQGVLERQPYDKRPRYEYRLTAKGGHAAAPAQTEAVSGRVVGSAGSDRNSWMPYRL